MIPAVLILAALPPLDAADLKADASLIVVAEVQQHYTSSRERRAGFTDTLHVYEARVVSTEKGEAAAGTLVYARAWTAAKRPDGWTGPGGVRGLPAVGATVRLYLRKGADGGLHILDPNGVEPVKPPKR